MTADRTCRKCGTTKQIDEFPHNKVGPEGFDKMCKECWRNRKVKTFTGSTKVEVPEVVVPDNISMIVVPTLSALPRSWLKEWQGPLDEGLAQFIRQTGSTPTVVYRFGATNKFFIPIQL